MTAYSPGGAPPLDQPYPGIPFGEAYKRFWKKGFTFTGRASRSEYWKAYLLTTGAFVIVYLVSIITVGVVGGLSSEAGYDAVGIGLAGGAVILLALLYALACLVPAIAVGVRRLHDTNQSGLMYLLGFVPFVGGIILLVLMCLDSNPQGARFDVRPGGAPGSGYGPPPGGASYGATPAPYGAPPPAAYGTPPSYSAPQAPPVPPQAPPAR